MATSQSLPQARTRTFGVELEFIVVWIWDDEPDPHESRASGLPPILKIPKETREGYIQKGHNLFQAEVEGGHQVQEYIRDVLRNNGVPAQLANNRTSAAFSVWEAKRDPSIDHRERIKWTGIELTSPVERALPIAFSAINYALNLIKSTYRVMVNDSCGFHVHVGDGKEPMPLEHVKRVASLFWAADPVIAILHPPRRRIGKYSQSIRERTPLSRGKKMTDIDSSLNHKESRCSRYFARGIRCGESPISWRITYRQERMMDAFEATRNPDHFQPFFPMNSGSHEREDLQNLETEEAPELDEFGVKIHIEKARKAIANAEDKRLSEPRSPMPKRLTPRFAIPKPLDDPPHSKYSFMRLGERAKIDIGVFAGVREIFAANSSCVIAGLLDVGERPNYNIFQYKCWEFAARGRTPKTIEFREAEGTTSGPWAEMWSKICVGLTDFAIHAPVDRFISILYSLEQAISYKAPYDVVDLLQEVGLFAEAIFAEKRLLSYKDIWGLEYNYNIDDTPQEPLSKKT
ncbi:hypothetical protein F5Y11DRAFT_361944 [Daldinia sp. FL1419]|nr:hypothetical protein F5Y11DRAFT_361944 [Daldinia sp. FL1419]